MISYPLPHQKGRSIALFWAIFNLGGGVGSFISLGINYNRTKAGTVSDSTYIAFMVIMLVGWVLSFFLLPAHLVRRSNGTRAAPIPDGMRETGPWYSHFTRTAGREVRHIIRLKDDWRIFPLIPMCFAANWFYSWVKVLSRIAFKETDCIRYQQNFVNGANFSLRARSLNSALYWLAQMFGGAVIGLLLDTKYLNRPRRALAGWTFVFVMGNVIMGGGLAFQNWSASSHHKKLRAETDEQGRVFEGTDYRLFGR